MCMSTPRVPPPSPPPQEQKQPDTVNQRRKSRQTGMGAGTLLTSPSGVATSGISTGGATLLGG